MLLFSSYAPISALIILLGFLPFLSHLFPDIFSFLYTVITPTFLRFHTFILVLFFFLLFFSFGYKSTLQLFYLSYATYFFILLYISTLQIFYSVCSFHNAPSFQYGTLHSLLTFYFYNIVLLFPFTTSHLFIYHFSAPTRDIVTRISWHYVTLET